jgi:hypothetical protein
MPIDVILPIDYKIISDVGVFPTAECIHWDCLGSNDGHHKFIILVQGIIGKVEKERESGFSINVGYSGPMITRKTIVEALEESVDLVFIGLCSRKNNYGFTKIEGWACYRFFISKYVVFGDFSWELLGKEVPLQAFMHVGI